MRVYMHSGGTGGFRAEWLVMPDVQQALIVMVSNGEAWPSPSVTDTFDRYDVTIGGITWHVKDGCFLKSLNREAVKLVGQPGASKAGIAPRPWRWRKFVGALV